jgi:hypothetical protein
MGRPMRRAASLLLPTLVALLLAGSVPASADDVVVLKNGSRLEGRIVSEDDVSLLLESGTGVSKTSIRISRANVGSIERGASTDPSGPASPADKPRDEWSLLSSGGRVVGWRHVLVARTTAAGGGWRIEESVRLFASARMPAVEVLRIEDVDARFLPRSFHYRERGEAGTAPGGAPAYETVRQGDVEAGTWRASEREGGTARDVAVPLPAGAAGPLAAREALLRAEPRTAGLAQVLVVDPARPLDGEHGLVRRVRAGFSSLGGVPAGGGAPQDVFRWEDGESVLDSRWAPGLPPRCLSEQVAPGVVATAATQGQTEAAEAKAREEATGREVSVPEAGLALTLPGASWTAELPPSRSDVSGPRAVARLSGRLLAADVRVEWDPKGAARKAPGDDGSAAEAALLERLRTVSPDLEVVEPRAPAASPPGAFRLLLSGTVRGERLKTLVLVADRGDARATLLASCPESAWADAKSSLESVLSSFRWF